MGFRQTPKKTGGHGENPKNGLPSELQPFGKSEGDEQGSGAPKKKWKIKEREIQRTTDFQKGVLLFQN